MSAMAAAARTFRDASWLSAERARAYSWIFLLAAGLGLAGLFATSHGGLDAFGKPLGTDFQSFWAASKLALQGDASRVYDLAAHAAVERAAFDGGDPGYAAFFYPPLFLLICLPLGLLPYTLSLAAWATTTGYAYWRSVRALAGETGLALPVLAFPAVFVTVGHGQNSFLTAALFAGTALALPARPLIAGLLIGALAFKPHLGLLIPLALLAAGRWRTIFAAAASVVVFSAAALAAFGLETWKGFLAVSPLARTALEQDLVGAEKMQSAFAAVRLLHGPLGLAWGVQAAVTLGAAVLLVAAARRTADGRALGALIAAAALPATPFLLDYDLIILAVPAAWILAQARSGGFRPWEKSVLAAAFILPLVSRPVAAGLGVPLAPLVVLAVLALVVRRILDPGGNRALTLWRLSFRP